MKLEKEVFIPDAVEVVIVRRPVPGRSTPAQTRIEYYSHRAAEAFAMWWRREIGCTDHTAKIYINGIDCT